jgi:methylated-DNA-[protein]-cysteine S-methyltransferase
MQYCYFDSPIGRLLLAGNKHLNLLGFPKGSLRYEPQQDWEYNSQCFMDWKTHLNEYFDGKRQIFDLPYEVQGTEFQKRVLSCVAKVPYATTSTYGDIAKEIQQPTAARAVGMANARNRLPIIIPCHRIIGKNGNMTGFGGGIDVKQFLLQLEKA